MGGDALTTLRVFDAFAATGDWARAVRSVIGADPAGGIVVVQVDRDGSLRADVGPARTAIAGQTVPIDVVIDSAADADLSLTVAGHRLRVTPRGAAVQTIDLDGADPAFTGALDGRTLRVEGAARTAAAATLRLRSPRCARWSVTDASGGAWFPAGMLAKWDVHHRPFVHGHDLTLAVPAEPETMAPAWPIVLPSGAVKPAT